MRKQMKHSSRSSVKSSSKPRPGSLASVSDERAIDGYVTKFFNAPLRE
jgi:hypothetical protein